MALYFVTGNEEKFREIKQLIPQIEQLDSDLPEIQSLDPEKIIQAKLSEVAKNKKDQFIVEDTSLFINGMHGLPGPLIKWFSKTVENRGLLKMAKDFGDMTAKAKVLIGYGDAYDIKFFEGIIMGTIVEPKGGEGFGWDSIFMPQGSQKTFAQMSLEEKNEYSMRRKAVKKLMSYLK